MVIERLSPSSINKFLNDYGEWYERYILGIKIPANIYMCAGTACHNFLEHFFKEKAEPGDTIKTFATRNFNKHIREYVENNEELIALIDPEIMTLTDIRDWLYRRIGVWIIEAERHVTKWGIDNAIDWTTPTIAEEHIINEELKVHGYIDAVFTNDKWNKMSKALTFTLVDYKTSSKDYKVIPTEYYLQLLIYAMLKNKQNKRVDWVVVDYLKHGQKYIFRVTKDQFKRVEELIKAVWKEVEHVLTLSEEDQKKYKVKTKMIDYL